MKFYMAWLADRNGNILEAEICADYCLEHVINRLKEHTYLEAGDDLQFTEIGGETVKLHWSARIIQPRDGGDWNTRWEES